MVYALQYRIPTRMFRSNDIFSETLMRGFATPVTMIFRPARSISFSPVRHVDCLATTVLSMGRGRRASRLELIRLALDTLTFFQ